MASQKKPPIVTILGHVDHGKTTLLEYILRTYGPTGFRPNLTAREAGGITQKVRAFEVTFKGQRLTFIDTPGHEAFTRLRDRGAQIADVALLIVAAEEGVKPQTKESLDLLKAYSIPFIVTFNKIDKPSAAPDKIKQQLAELGVMVEGWGGDVPCAEVSALHGQGVEALLDLVLLMSDLRELSCDPDQPATGYVLEAVKDPKKGTLATIVLQNGSLRVGDLLATASTSGKIKFLEDAFGGKPTSAVVSAPVVVNGFAAPPFSGELFRVVTDATLKAVQTELAATEENFSKKVMVGEGEPIGDYNLVIRADHLGSLEALERIFQAIAETLQVKITIIRADLGPVTQEDVKLAKGGNVIVLAFNVRTPRDVIEAMQSVRVPFLVSEIIYELEEKLREHIEAKQKFGEAKGELAVLAVFGKTSSKKTIGGEVKFGSLRTHNRIIIIRPADAAAGTAETVLGKGKILTLQQSKNVVGEIEAGKLCGLVIETEVEIAVGDKIIAQ